MRGAGSMSACQTPNVLQHLLVDVKNVLILAIVAPMLIAPLEITRGCAHAFLGLQEIHMIKEGAVDLVRIIVNFWTERTNLT